MTSLIAVTVAVPVVFVVVVVVVRAAGVGATRPRALETTPARSRRPVKTANAKASTPIARRRIAPWPPVFFGGGGGGGISGAVVAGSESYMRISLSRRAQSGLRAP